MSTTNNNQPLATDPSRVAAPSLRGYRAQIWRSVLAWVHLGEDERLFLEGAEDFDRIQGSSAEATQIKDASGNVSLRSPDIIDAINNAWRHRKQNPRHEVKYRFLTTAGVAKERGQPLGEGVAGLNLWQQARLSTDPAERQKKAERIADFLMAEGKVSRDVLTFLRASTPEQIWKDLIAAIEWDTDAEATADVIMEIRDRLVMMGHKISVPPEHAEAVAEDLFADAFAAATLEDDRYLTHAGLLRRFSKSTHISLPISATNALFAAMQQQLMPADESPIAVGEGGKAIASPPPLPSRYYERNSVLTDVYARLLRHPILILRGSTGVGKSITAAGHAQKAPADWGWVDLRGLDARALAAKLEQVASELVADDEAKSLVFDDIEWPSDSRGLEALLVRIKNQLLTRSGNLIITCAAEPPQRIVLSFGLGADGALSVPAFQQAEIESFLIARGCHQEVSKAWATAIELHTSGHAQLVHARVETLERDGFPKPSLESFTNAPADVGKAKTEALRIISLLDSSSRELIYRLSLTIQSLPKRKLLAIARQPPPVEEPGLALERVVGPWLEVAADGLYRISPLLRGIGTEVQGEDWAKAMHASIAKLMLGFRTLTPSDVSSILFHATLAQDWKSAARLAIGILRSKDEIWEALSFSAGWFKLVGVGTLERPKTDQFSLIMIRLAQFKLAVASNDKESVDAIIACTDAEVSAGIGTPQLRIARYFFLAQVLMASELMSTVTLVKVCLEYIHLSDELAKVLTQARGHEFDKAITGPDGVVDFANIAGFSILTHLVNRESLSALLDACENIEQAPLRRLLQFLGSQEAVAQMVLSRIWTAEYKRNPPDWEACHNQFERLYALGRRCNLGGLAQGAVRGIAIIVGETLNKPEEALQLLDRAAAEVGVSSGIEDQRAVLLCRKGDFVAALEVWRRLLPNWVPTTRYDLQQCISYRLAAIAAGRLGEWAEAASFLNMAWKLADGEAQATYRAALLIDEGFAHWKAGNNQFALDRAAQGLQAIDKLPPDANGDEFYILRKRAGHTLMWMQASMNGTLSEEYAAPLPAMCSSLDPVPSAPREPSTPSDMMWTHLLQFELAANLGGDLFAAHESRLKNSPFGIARIVLSSLRIEHRLHSLSLDDFVEVVAEHGEALMLANLYYKVGGLTADLPFPADVSPVDRRDLPSEFVLGRIANALFAMAAQGAFSKDQIDRLRTSAVRAGLADMTEQWLDFVQAVLIAGSTNWSEELADPNHGWPWHLVVSLKVATDPETRPSRMLKEHAQWANLRRVLLTKSEIEVLVIRAWRRWGDDPFLLSRPIVSGPALIAACESSSRGWKKVGEILSAATNAVAEPIPDRIREVVQKLLEE